MGLFDRKPAPAADAIARSSDDESVTLSNPGLPDSDLTQIGYKLFDVCGLTYVVYGPGSLTDLFAQITLAAPAFRNSVALPNSLGSLAGREDSVWLGFEGPEGAVFAFYCFPDGDANFLMKSVMDPLRGLPVPWSLGIATLDASVPAPVANILRSGRALPSWDLPGVGGATAPVEPESPAFPALLRQRLEESGWEPLDGELFKAVVTTGGDRSQLIYLAAWSRTSFAVMSPVAGSPDGTIPPALLAGSFGEYTLDVIADMVVLVDELPAGPPSPLIEEFRDRAIALAGFADRVEADLSTDDVY